MKRYIKAGYYLGDYYVSDAEAEEFQYYADHPELLDSIDEQPIDRTKFPETYNFLEHKAEIDAGVSSINEKFGEWKWSVKLTNNSLRLYWDYFRYVNEPNPYIELSYNQPVDKYDCWFTIVDPTGKDITYEVEFNDSDIVGVLVGLAGYIVNRW